MPQSKQLTDLKNNVINIFTEYLAKKALRRTPERYAILDEIYSTKGHFDVEQLFEKMKIRNYTVSRATVYNTLDLLIECNLVIKHQFGANQAVFEKAHGYKQHDHLICNKCNNILEFCDPRIQQIQNMMGELLQFNVESHSLYLYGQPKVDKNGACTTCKKNIESK
ncbi:MAG: transcriptional repressor [Bacteroidetes bacterium]|nr:transcriptional repressor [Bacteroidota bacterium]